ncbi:adenylylsulfate kinase [Chitinophaga eiseniae]|uniref:Adenylyl-sulfate kinase n=1 Tax=Chitinophaga eiseniae TaxID=634771 RepID=A0A1T4U6Y5_9BACT|nr:adenylyl-sulfate kinase [Chitinophaga eiseniae]SKA48443.1 adenylylsulfate kinase [Chitinophaga eiseniae]
MKKGFTIWLTGYSGSGKTTISEQLYQSLTAREIRCEKLDGDIIRQHLSKGLSFSREDRCENILRIGFIAEMLSRHGVGVIVSAISPYREARNTVRNKIANFIEVHVSCPIEECARRDVKGLYQRAMSGEITNFTGISDPYEAPLDAEITCDTARESIDESTDKILRALCRMGII